MLLVLNKVYFVLLLFSLFLVDFFCCSRKIVHTYVNRDHLAKSVEDCARHLVILTLWCNIMAHWDPLASMHVSSLEGWGGGVPFPFYSRCFYLLCFPAMRLRCGVC